MRRTGLLVLIAVTLCAGSACHISNYPVTATVLHLDQTYCDPTLQNHCVAMESWNPNYPDWPGGGTPPGPHDVVFDETVLWRGREAYHVPLDGTTASFVLTAEDGTRTTAPIFGRHNLYLDDRLRMALPIGPNMRHQLAWLENWQRAHGARAEVEVTFGQLVATYQVKFLSHASSLQRF